MIRGIPKREVPQWLNDAENLSALPIDKLLANSLFYPSSGRDGDPVRYLGGFIHSFIYVDYGIEHDEVWNSLHDAHHGFRGYRIIDCRDVSQSELTPCGSEPVYHGPTDRVPLVHRDYPKERFAIWSVHERGKEWSDDYGPERFSLLYICGDGVAMFRALYHRSKQVPDVVAVIQPGTGFGHNWTDFREPSQIFGRSVLHNPSGTPQYLLCSGLENDRETPCWPEYSELVHYWRVCDGELGLWKRGVPTRR